MKLEHVYLVVVPWQPYKASLFHSPAMNYRNHNHSQTISTSFRRGPFSDDSVSFFSFWKDPDPWKCSSSHIKSQKLHLVPHSLHPYPSLLCFYSSMGGCFLPVSHPIIDKLCREWSLTNPRRRKQDSWLLKWECLMCSQAIFWQKQMGFWAFWRKSEKREGGFWMERVKKRWWGFKRRDGQSSWLHVAWDCVTRYSTLSGILEMGSPFLHASQECHFSVAHVQGRHHYQLTKLLEICLRKMDQDPCGAAISFP